MTEENNEEFNKETEMGENSKATPNRKPLYIALSVIGVVLVGVLLFGIWARVRVEMPSRLHGRSHSTTTAPDKQQKLRPNKLSPFCPIRLKRSA